MMGHNKGLHMVTWILVIIGGLNWLLVGLGWNLVDMIFGMSVAKIVYILVGLSAIYEITIHKAICKLCGGMGQTSSMGSMPMGGMGNMPK